MNESVVSEATALPTVPQPLLIKTIFCTGLYRRNCSTTTSRLALQLDHAGHGFGYARLVQPRRRHVLALRGRRWRLRHGHPPHRARLHLGLAVLVHAAGRRQKSLPGNYSF